MEQQLDCPITCCTSATSPGHWDWHDTRSASRILDSCRLEGFSRCPTTCALIYRYISLHLVSAISLSDSHTCMYRYISLHIATERNMTGGSDTVG
jgi:hypothetical protein